MKYLSPIFVFVLMLTFSISFAQTKWTKYKGNPILSGGISGSWDGHVIQPFVLKQGEEWKMWFCGAGGIFRIGYATSEDGIDWDKYADNPIMNVGLEGSWDDQSLYNPQIIFDGSIYHMWYGGWDGTASPDFGVANARLGYATSPDGINWTKYENNPVLGLCDSCWYADGFAGHSLLYIDSVYHYWFGGINDTIVKIGYARSVNGIDWQVDTLNNPVLEPGEPGEWDSRYVFLPNVLYNPDRERFEMWYHGGTNSDFRRIGFATSPDGISWTKYSNNPVLSPSSFPLDWDSRKFSGAHVILSEGMYKMWYASKGPDETIGERARIGYATSPVILNVPDEFETIQQAIDTAVDGNVVLVDEGTYYENINFKGNAITVSSHYWLDDDTSHISRTIIDGSQPVNPDSGSVVYFLSGEDTTSVIMGFTITGGSGTYDPIIDGYGGAGINIFGLGASGGKIIHNKIINNKTISNSKTCGGAGILAFFAEPDRNLVIEYNEIQNNSVSGPVSNQQGGGIYCKWISNTGYLRISNNIITGNSVTCTGTYKAIAGGIGLSIDLPTAIDAVVENNIITYNELHCKASIGAGIYIVYWEPGGQFTDSIPTPIIQNNIIAHNYSQDRGAGIGIWTVQKYHVPKSTINPQPAIINNTIVNNKASDGSGIFNFDSYPLLLNNILWDDLSVEGSREIFNDDINYPEYADKINDGELYVYYSDIQGGLDGVVRWEGDSIINSNPMFEEGSYELSKSSYCIGSGIDSVEINNVIYRCPKSDYEGNPRPNPQDSNPDIGAYESPLGTDIEKSIPNFPKKFALFQNYPNPFNPKTIIRYSFPVTSHIDLSVYNILGQKVATLVNKKQPVGNHSVEWNASGFASGIYYYKLTVDPSTSSGRRFQQVKKMVLIK